MFWPRRISCWLTSDDPHDLADAGRDYFVDRDAYLRAYELASGAGIGRVELPSNAYGAPMSYTAGGRQYVVVPLGDEGARPNWSPWPIPHEDEELPPQGRDRSRRRPQSLLRGRKSHGRWRQRDATEAARRSYPDLATARGYFDEYYEYPHFRGATLLHHLAGEPATSATAPKRG